MKQDNYWEIEMFPEYPAHPHTPYLVRARNGNKTALFKIESQNGVTRTELKWVKRIILKYLKRGG